VGDPKKITPHETDFYTQYFAIEATGHRIGLMICKRCGAAVLIGDEEVDGPALHDRWHERLNHEFWP